MPDARRIVALVSGAVLLAACSSSPTPASSSSSPADVAAQLTAIAALAPEEREAQLRTLSADVERQLVTLSGLEKELGGPEKATAAYTAMIVRTAVVRATRWIVGTTLSHAIATTAPWSASWCSSSSAV